MCGFGDSRGEGGGSNYPQAEAIMGELTQPHVSQHAKLT